MESSAGTYTIVDLEHMGRPESIAACILESSDGFLVVDPGPASTLPALERALAALGAGVADLRAVLLTHIHLDHAAASGTLARENPGITVYVHERGAGHMADPAKLLQSATRLYGHRMHELWGTMEPVPADQLRALAGGERLTFGERRLTVAYTPGHAWHHLTWFDEASGTAFVGDTAGLRTPGLPVVLPVTPPPDFDLEAWLASIDRILLLKPTQLVLTHFGPSPDPAGHLASLREGLLDWTDLARLALAEEGDDGAKLARFVDGLVEWTRSRVPAEQAERYLDGAGPESCWRGLKRYWERPAKSG
ncbi:MAG: MBL fold metallo-hydrolase [Gemmatimonadales bacterium]|nr:MBL fold metallo-hydrolase [Gemmatimonadales bacterium]